MGNDRSPTQQENHEMALIHVWSDVYLCERSSFKDWVMMAEDKARDLSSKLEVGRNLASREGS
jgi:hypothetical protein